MAEDITAAAATTDDRPNSRARLGEEFTGLLSAIGATEADPPLGRGHGIGVSRQPSSWSAC